MTSYICRIHGKVEAEARRATCRALVWGNGDPCYDPVWDPDEGSDGDYYLFYCGEPIKPIGYIE